jgi:hypothetical protein
MPLALILAAVLSQSPAPAVDRSLSDVDRLTELRIDVDSALRAGQIDPPTAAQLYLGIERTKRQMFRMGMQFGYRQRVRLRERIDRLYARLAQSRTPIAADIRSEK